MTKEQTPQDANEGTMGPSRSTAGLCVGSKVRLLKGIYDHGEDHHPPGWIAHAGEVLVVRYIGSEGDAGFVAVSHEDVTDKSFWILRGEFETHNDKAQGAGGGLIAGGSPGATGYATTEKRHEDAR